MYTVLLRNNETGEEVTYTHSVEWDDVSHYLWTDGNYACDCNRSDFFAQAKGIPEDPSKGCGHDKYSAFYATLANGERVMLDAE